MQKKPKGQGAQDPVALYLPEPQEGSLRADPNEKKRSQKFMGKAGVPPYRRRKEGRRGEGWEEGGLGR